jgi:hypothetical protein
MRAFALCLVSVGLISLTGCIGSDRDEGFTATGPNSFLYSARTSTTMTENDDGEAERIRQGWLIAALKEHGMCANGFVVDTHRFVPGEPTASGPQFSNGGDILYSGRCSAPGAPVPPVAPSPAVTPVPVRG